MGVLAVALRIFQREANFALIYGLNEIDFALKAQILTIYAHRFGGDESLFNTIYNEKRLFLKFLGWIAFSMSPILPACYADECAQSPTDN